MVYCLLRRSLLKSVNDSKIKNGARKIQCFRYNMTQHIKTHFKERGINSLASNGFKAFLGENASGSDNDIEASEGQPGIEDEEGFEEEEEIEPC